MTRSMMLGAAALAALTGSPVAGQDVYVSGDGITVTGPRAQTQRESGSMMEMSRFTGATTISYADLDLRTIAGRNALQNRIAWAARQTCNRLEKLNRSNIPLTRDEPCVRQAVFFAQDQVNQAIARYGY